MYVNIIDEYNVDGTPKIFRMLPDKAKLTFLMLMCLASKFGGVIPSDSETWIKRQTGLRTIDIESLVDHGYIIRGQNSENIKNDATTASRVDAKKKSSVMQNDVDSHRLRSETETDIQNPPTSPHGDFCLSGETEKPTEKVNPVNFSAEFLEFWMAYPRKTCKDYAYRCWQKAKKKVAAQVMIAAIKKQVANNHFKGTDGGYRIPNPSTWLNKGRWDDEVDTGSRPESKPSSITQGIEKPDGNTMHVSFPDIDTATRVLTSKGYVFDTIKSVWRKA